MAARDGRRGKGGKEARLGLYLNRACGPFLLRSLLVVCALASIAFLSSGRMVESAIAMALILPCFARYYERRLKGTTQAYIHVITLHRLGGLRAPRE